jgi:energy-converting hydrogenase A subunit M
MDPITNNLISKVEPALRGLGDKSINTNVQINKLTDTLKSETKENEKPIKRKKKEAIEATGAASAGAYSAPLFSQSEPEKSPEASKVKVVEEGLTGGETAEATATGASTGQYSTPGWVAPNKKQWRGRAKTQIPGGKFVTIKKKCQKFPYCNQGDIKSLKIFENERIEKIIKNISKKHNISENVIKNILSYELDVFRKYKK